MLGAFGADDLEGKLVQAGQMLLGQLGKAQVGRMHIDQPLLVGGEFADAVGRQIGQSSAQKSEHGQHGEDLVGDPRSPESCHYYHLMRA